MEKKAVAIKYEEGDNAPRIVAKGADRIADLILKIARDNGIMIEENRALSEALMKYDVGDYIPEELYQVVAEILAFVYSLNLD